MAIERHRNSFNDQYLLLSEKLSAHHRTKRRYLNLHKIEFQSGKKININSLY